MKKEPLDDRLDFRIWSTLKKDLEELAIEDDRDFHDFLRLELKKIVKERKNTIKRE